jgi:hypothetical protein
MGETLEYARPAPREPFRLLAACAHFTLVYPILALGLLYGQWMISWCILGHMPRPYVDDPAQITVANGLHSQTHIAFAGLIPAIWAGIALNLVYVPLRQLGLARGAQRGLVFVAVWLGAYLLIRHDPFSVVSWLMADPSTLFGVGRRGCIR